MFETIENLCEILAPLEVEVWVSPEPLPFERRREGHYLRLKPGESWGTLFDCGWFRFSGKVPAGERVEELALRLDVNGELLVVDSAGRPLRGLTNLSSVFDRTLGTPEKLFMPLSELQIKGETFEVWADAGCNDLFGALQQKGALRFAELVRRSPTMITNYFDRRFEQEAAEAGVKNDNMPIYAVGHSHLDLAWLWPLRESIRKGVRTFATALANMEQYPWYCFGASQPQLYEWVERHSPDLFAKIRERVAEGRWELQGAMWVESDTHMPDGESLMRQFIYGQRYWRKTFGCEVSNVWLPDVFGYSAALPGIARQNGADCVLTMKNAWNLFNPFPYNAFNWKGIDGSSVSACRLPEGTYNGSANAASVMKCVREDRERAITGASMMLYGIGDGGAGPGETHLECLARMTDRVDFPPIIHGKSAEFFDRLKANEETLPTCSGELYLENHQGTFTTCETIKKLNRRYEQTRQEMEFAAVVWNKALPEWYETWEKEMLLLQFHDILPGTSIERVYQEAEERQMYWQEKIADWYGGRNDQCFFNPSSEALHRFRKTEDGWQELCLPPFGCGSYATWQGEAIKLSERTLENGIIRLTFGEMGELTHWEDLSDGMDLLISPARFELYTDKGNAWNIDPGTYDAPLASALILEKQEMTADGPVGICRQQYRYGASRMQAEFRLSAGASCCEIFVTQDWQDPEHLMRFELLTRLDAPTAKYATQYGYKEFSTGSTSSIEKAQYEISAQRWVRLADAERGVSLISDCKYGYSVKGGKMNITLLRCPERPGAFVGKDDVARSGNSQYNDLGKHSFALAFAVDRSDLAVAPRIAEWLNRPEIGLPKLSRATLPILDWQFPHLSVSMLRPARDGRSVLLRVYERFGQPGKPPTQEGIALREVGSDGRPMPNSERKDFRPFEVKTYLMSIESTTQE